MIYSFAFFLLLPASALGLYCATPATPYLNRSGHSQCGAVSYEYAQGPPTYPLLPACTSGGLHAQVLYSGMGPAILGCNLVQSQFMANGVPANPTFPTWIWVLKLLPSYPDPTAAPTVSPTVKPTVSPTIDASFAGTCPDLDLLPSAGRVLWCPPPPYSYVDIATTENIGLNFTSISGRIAVQMYHEEGGIDNLLDTILLNDGGNPGTQLWYVIQHSDIGEFGSSGQFYFMAECESGDCSASLTTTVFTPAPTSLPTSIPSSTPTSIPSSVPTSIPTSAPTSSPTADPTAVPTASPTVTPTASPTASPTSRPTTYGDDLLARAIDSSLHSEFLNQAYIAQVCGGERNNSLVMESINTAIYALSQHVTALTSGSISCSAPEYPLGAFTGSYGLTYTASSEHSATLAEASAYPDLMYIVAEYVMRNTP